MVMPQNFRSAFNGFNREDVVHYLEYLNNRHASQINQLTTENEMLRAQLEAMPQVDEVSALEARCQELTEELEQMQARCAELEQQAPQTTQETVLSSYAAEELEAYRRAERIEREARERAELVYFQANSVLMEACAKVDGLSLDMTDMADKVMSQLTQLQMAVSSSKQALQDAASIMNAIRPNK